MMMGYSSESDIDYEPPQYKRKKLSDPQICIVSEFSDARSNGYDIVIAPKSSSSSSSSSSSPNTMTIRPAFRLKTGWDSYDTFAFCGLGSTLYLFDDEPSTSAYRLDLSPHLLASGLPTVELGIDDLTHVSCMRHPKRLNQAIPTPDGTKILVFSKLIKFDRDTGLTGCNDFELYDPSTDTWLLLPGIQDDCFDGLTRIMDYAFVDDTTFFIQMDRRPSRKSNRAIFCLNLDTIARGWRRLDNYFGARSIHMRRSFGRFHVIEETLCVTPHHIYDLRRRRDEESLVVGPWAPDFRVSAAVSVWLVDGNKVGGKYTFCTLTAGIRRRTREPKLVMALHHCDVARYREHGELSNSILPGERFDIFPLGHSKCREFDPVLFFTISN
ncbi:pyrimidine-specific ribonucleoside hydrolase RihA [Striga asiatica]|uniref:Pyrimidine-specific ribonucleoside hydrolase RihA n=1 Tax=Striga asiatica TaxID=4170 RepID=A0A5A7R2L9_STRAF|nr:pyrimidine-specific ribonucleoside hydrolase RihA [Striga asiatica]